MSASSTSRFTYRAFLSYSHQDKAWADWLHKTLETYRVPARLVGKVTVHGSIPARLNPIFRDRDELASATSLNNEIGEALAQSENLIVICSPAATASRWVNEEVLAFKRLGHGERIFCLIVAGEPGVSDWPGHESGECFCPALRFTLDQAGQLSGERTEPIAADVRPGKDGKPTARLKLIAGMLGVGFDTLVQREAHRRRRRMWLVTTAALLGMAITSVLALNAVIARNEARQRQEQTEAALNYMLGDLHDKLQGVGRLDLMAAVADKALALFATGKPGSLSDQELTQQSRALVQIGSIRLDEGGYEPAMDAFRRAYQRSLELTTRHPGNGRFLYDRAQAEYWIGYVYWQERKLDEANTWLTRYRDSTLALVKIDPHNRDWLIETTYGENNLAALALDRDDLDAAQKGFRSELETQRRMIAQQPGDAQLASDAADTVSWLGTVAERRGDLAEAERQFSEQSREFAALRAAHPDDFQRLADWATAQNLLAEALRITGRNTESSHAIAEATEGFRTLTQHDPENMTWRVSLAGILIRNATYAFADNDVTRAGALVSEGMEHLQATGTSMTTHNLRAIPGNLSEAWLLRARIAMRRGDLKAATAAAERSLAEARKQTINSDAGLNIAANQANALLVLGMLQQAQAPGTPPPAWTQARALLSGLVQSSRYWRVLDPWIRVCRLTGNDDQARAALARLDATGYVPLFPWPPAGGPSPSTATEGDQHVH